MPNEIKRGTIILAMLDDHNGKVSKHFAIVTSKTVDIERGEDLAVVGISTSYRLPLPSHWHFLETHPTGNCQTGLRESCVAKSDWQDSVKQSDVIAVKGRAPAGIVKQILKFIEEQS